MKSIIVLLVFLALYASAGAKSYDYVFEQSYLSLNPPRINNSLSNGDVDAYDTIIVTSPNGGEYWFVGETHDITWTHEGTYTTNVNILLTTDGGSNWTIIFYSTPNDDKEAWTIPDLTTNYPLTQCKVRITDSATTNYTGDESDSFFTIDKTGFKKDIHALYLPASFSLSLAPNPFRGSTTINYSNKNSCRVSIKVYDITGKEVAIIKDGFATAGKHSLVWNTGLKAGIYICRMNAGNKTMVHRMTVLP